MEGERGEGFMRRKQNAMERRRGQGPPPVQRRTCSGVKNVSPFARQPDVVCGPVASPKAPWMEREVPGVCLSEWKTLGSHDALLCLQRDR